MIRWEPSCLIILARPGPFLVCMVSDHPILIPAPSAFLSTQTTSSIFRRRWLSLASTRNRREIRHGVERRETDQAHDTAASVAGNGPARRQHDLRDGTARRVPATLRALATMRRMGSERSRSMACVTAIRAHTSCATPRRYSTALSAGESAGSSSKSGIDGGMRTAAYFWPATQASMMFDHSCIMCRRCTSYSALL